MSVLEGGPTPVGRSWFRGFPRTLATSLFSVFFPSDCRVCGSPLVNVSRLPVCRECLDGVFPIDGAVCGLCGERILSPYAVSRSGNQLRCGLCRRVEPVFARAVAYGSYESGLRELIHLLKYGGVRPAANVLGRMLAEAIRELASEFGDDSVVVVPVPLHRAKLRQRGFNQAELIARAALKSGILSDRLRLNAGLLERKRDTSSQTGLTSHQRRENLRGAFAVARTDVLRGREVLVVDDVYTTGATVSECARILLRGGAAKVWVATVARTLKISARYVEIGSDLDSHGTEGTGSGAAVPQVSMARAAGG
ncbi:MAG: ComF family protein [Candidatus Sulfotelmatobacter sp.]